MTNAEGSSTPASELQYSAYLPREGTPESSIPFDDVTKRMGEHLTEEPLTYDVITAEASPLEPFRRSVLNWQFSQYARPSASGLFRSLRRATDPETWTYRGRRFSWLHRT